MATKAGERDEKKENTNNISKKVLFVRNLSYDINDKEFEKAFSEIGPLRRSYLIKEKGNPKKCRGFGYVTFAFEEDAQKAMDTVKSLDGRHLKITFSKKRPRQNRKERHHNVDEKSNGSGDEHKDDDADDNGVDDHTTIKENEQGSENSDKHQIKIKKRTIPSLHGIPSSKKKRKPKSQRALPETDAGRTVYVIGLPSTITTKEIYKRCRKIGDIEKTVFPVEGRDEPVAGLTFKTPAAARTAVTKLNKKTIKGKEVTAVLKSKEHQQTSQKTFQKSRLIIRNLSFRCTEAILREFFSQYGDIAEINIPHKLKEGKEKKQGFAFVQFLDVFSAAKAREKMNLKNILGRPVAVDWAIPKDQYIQVEKLTSENCSEKASRLKDNDDEGVDDGESPDINDINEDDHSSDYNEEKSDDEDDEGEEDDEDDKDDDDKDDDDDDDKDDECSGNKKRPSDVKEGLTVFITNLNFDTTEKALHQFFKKFGDISFCKIVTDRVMQHSKGTAFVKFKAVESVEKCMAEANVEGDESCGLFLDGFKLRVHIAVTQGKVQNLRNEEKKAKKEPRDKRNLYLAREGVIAPESDAARDLSKTDLQKRKRAEIEKKSKLNNPNYFVSTTRLCVRNLPLTTTENDLKKIFSTSGSSSDEKPAFVKKVLIMRSKERLDSSGKGRSLGFGFVEFTNHKAALTALRQTNNNPKIFGANRRPIVEFSIENSLALKSQQQRMKRSKLKEKRTGGNDPVTKTHKERRIEKALRRKEKRKLKKQEKKQNGSIENKNDKLSSTEQGKIGLLGKKSSPSKNTLKKKNKHFLEKKHQKRLNAKKAKPKKIVSAENNEPVIKRFKSKKDGTGKRRAADTKEEAKFDDIVQKYKDKLFGDSSLNIKRSRWFE